MLLRLPTGLKQPEFMPVTTSKPVFTNCEPISFNY